MIESSVCLSVWFWKMPRERERAGGTRRKAAVLMGRAIVDLWRGGGEGKKTESVDIFFLVFLIDVLCRGWIEEWIGIGLRVGMGVY